MFELPKRISLAELTAISIRKAIASGVWKGYLPTERRLAEIFKVSRPTIRASLHLLANEHWLDIRKGRRNRLVLRDHRPVVGKGPAGSAMRVICFITQTPEPQWTLAISQAFSEIRSRLASHGYSTEVLLLEGTDLAAHQRELATYLEQNEISGCVLMSLKYELHRWFAERAVPTLVIGGADPVSKLPSVQTDLRSLCRHAAGVFIRHGHRHLALVVPDIRRGGNLSSEEGFIEGAKQAPSRYGVRATIVRHNNSAQNVVDRLEQTMNAADPPTAFLVARPPHFYTALFYFQRRGLRVPEEVSLISRDPDYSFLQMAPAITHYSFEAKIFANRVTRLLLKLVGEKHLPPKSTLIEHEYSEGATVATPSAAR